MGDSLFYILANSAQAYQVLHIFVNCEPVSQHYSEIPDAINLKKRFSLTHGLEVPAYDQLSPNALILGNT